jgi:thymidylate synthase ThyX
MLRKAARGAARDILPIATEAIMVMSANARAIWNCIYLRANEHAEAVIREIYVQIAKIMEKEMPALFNGLKYEKCWDGSEVVLLPRDKL